VGGMHEWKQVTFGNGYASQSQCRLLSRHRLRLLAARPLTLPPLTFDEICLSVEYMACRSAAEPEAAAVLLRASSSCSPGEHGGGEGVTQEECRWW
jgi:hypothetical protein